MSEAEMRDNERYGLELPIRVSWKDVSGIERETKGTTRNISSSGALIVCDSPIAQGCTIDVQIDFPISLAGIRKSRVNARGRVVRGAEVSNLFQAYSHGVTFENMSFTRF